MAHLTTHDGYRIHEEFFTPDDARTMLDLHDLAENELGHKANRNLRIDKVNQYRRDMENDRWGWSPDLVTVTDDNLIIQGHHRLTALSRANTPGIWLLFADGVPRTQMYNFDTGIKRTTADQLELKAQAPNRNQAAAVLQSLREYDPATGNDRRVTYSIPEMLEDYERQSDTVQECVRQARLGVKLGLPTKTFYPVWWELFRISPHQCTEFYRLLCASELTLARGPAEQPITALRMALMESAQGKGRTLEPRRARAYMIRAWNAWRTGKQIRGWRFADGDNYPQPR